MKKRSALGPGPGIVVGLALVIGAAAGRTPLLAQAARGSDHWVGTWATAVVPRPQAQPRATAAPANGAPQGQPVVPAAAPQNFNNQTAREIVHVSIGGPRVRVVLSNQFGTAPLVVGGAHIALRDMGASIQAKSDRALTFGGSAAVTVPPGAVVVSDPANLTVPGLADVAIDVYLPGDTTASPSPLSTGGQGQTSYVSQPGNHAGEPDFPGATPMRAWFFISRVEVSAPEPAGAIVTFGDSIVAGARSTPDTNNRWPDILAKRLNAQPGIGMGVLNVGIPGNRVLSDGGGGPGGSALGRFDRDVLTQTGAKFVLMMEGVNDIRAANATVTAADVIAGYRQIIERAHAKGLTVIGVTCTPFEGKMTGWTPEAEAKRQAMNDFIRSGRGYDGFIDFDAVLRDPNHPTQILAQYRSDDDIHPNDAGYQLLGDAIDLALFKAIPAARAAAR